MSYSATALPAALPYQSTKASQTAHSAHRRFTRIGEHQRPTMRVDDVWMAVLVVAVAGWMEVLAIALAAGIF
jgi:hypothetical protein